MQTAKVSQLCWARHPEGVRDRPFILLLPFSHFATVRARSAAVLPRKWRKTAWKCVADRRRFCFPSATTWKRALFSAHLRGSFFAHFSKALPFHSRLEKCAAVFPRGHLKRFKPVFLRFFHVPRRVCYGVRGAVRLMVVSVSVTSFTHR